ncbi:FecR domain-containing protein [Limisphaera sp. 4302-co]|uniref:FecR domain-containing protein n=1 Tax=Limisphaera sp. 4302-co TaxID=3400417 RepID=UPI003C169AF4
MKTTATWLKGFLVAATVLAFCSAALAETKNLTAKVTRIKGAARYSTDGTTWKTLRVGQALPAGTVIQTAANSMVDLVLGPEDTIRLAPQVTENLTVLPPAEVIFQPITGPDTVRLYSDTTLAIDRLTSTTTGIDEVRETMLDLRAGAIFGKVKRMSAASRYEVKIPNGVAGIRGTVYHINAQGVVSVLVGTVVLSVVGQDGRVITQVINAGYQYDVRTGQLTPLPDSLTQEMASAMQTVGTGEMAPPTVYTQDQTTIYVSPTTGTAAPAGSGSGSGGGV